MRRFVITRYTRDGTIVGHYVGPGKKSVLTMHRKLLMKKLYNLRRKENGRYVWK